MIFREIAKDEMKRRGITPMELARLTGKPRSTINNFLSERSKSPSMELGGPVAKALCIDLNALYGVEIPSMSSDEIHRLRGEHEALMAEYAYVKEAKDRETQEVGSLIEQLRGDIVKLNDQLAYMKRLYKDARSRIKWQLMFIIVLLVLVFLFAWYALRLDYMLPNIGMIQY